MGRTSRALIKGGTMSALATTSTYTPTTTATRNSKYITKNTFYTGIFFIVFGFFVYVFLFHFYGRTHNTQKGGVGGGGGSGSGGWGEVTQTSMMSSIMPPPAITSSQSSFSLTNPLLTNDPLNNPYNPPLKETSTYLLPTISVRGTSPDTQYQQIGILTPDTTDTSAPPSTNTLILPLMGKMEDGRRGKWKYYTMANGNGNVNTKLSLRVKGKKGTDEYGCDEIYDGDKIYVDGYNYVMTANVYDSNMFRYMI